MKEEFCLTLNNLEEFCIPSVFGIIIYHYVNLSLCCAHSCYYDNLIGKYYDNRNFFLNYRSALRKILIH